ncbi:hypothetical protein WDW37_16940 [Bdellovibrionota bacterium FG-1]
MFFFFILVAALTVIFPVVVFPEIYNRDWAYFESLSLLVRSSVLKYHVFPLHDPWCGGGTSLLANPQTRLFSPMGLMDLLFPPYWANLSGLVIYAALGCLGMYRLLRYLAISRETAIVAATLFINGSWFGLHFAEGHITFGTMQLLPWVLLFFLRIEKPRYLLALTALLSYFLLDGSIYTFIFAKLMMLSCLVFGVKSWRDLWRGLTQKPIFTALCVLGALLAVAPKVVPVYLEFRDRLPWRDNYALPFRYLMMSFFWPAQRIIFGTKGTPFGFHEFGCYLGLLLFPWVCWSLARDSVFRKASVRLLLVAFFWLWVGAGWWVEYNPWNLFQRIPLINNAHVQSRFLLLMFFFYMLVAARALDRLHWHNRKLMAFFCILLVESVVVRNFPFEIYLGYEIKTVVNRLMDHTTLDETKENIPKPYVYMTHNKATRACYEPAILPVRVIASSDPRYRGEIYLAQGQGSAQIESYIPGQLVVKASGPESKVAVINTSDLGHWKPALDGSLILSKRGELLRVAIPPGEVSVKLQFHPRYFEWLIGSWLAGWGIFLALFMFA